MSRRLNRFSLALVLLLSSEVWAVGLGDIRLDSALNEPLRAEIELLSATPEELSNLSITLASSETFARYGLDRPFYLQGIEFRVAADAPGGPVVQLRSRSAIAEPFLTFLVEATWSSGRLLREYTVLLDPPTYAPPAVQEQPAVQAPRRATPTDSAPIERPAPQPAPEPEPEPRPVAPVRTSPPVTRPAPEEPVYQEPAYEEPAPSYAEPEPSYASTPGGDYQVQRGETLWSIATRMRPDSRLTINQTMLAIFEANPAAFGGNINVLRAGSRLRVPSADDVFRIDRGGALAEVQRQHNAWGGGTVVAPDSGYAPDAAETRPSLTLVPPDEEPAGGAYDDEIGLPPTREEEIESRIAELEAADVPDQQSLIEIRDNELAALRQELADIRGEIYEPPIDATLPEDEATADEGLVGDAVPDDEALDEPFAEGEPIAEDAVPDEVMAEDETADGAAEDADAEKPAVPTTIVRSAEEPGIVDRIMGILTSIWTRIIAALLVVAGLLLWFVRRGREEDDDSGPWDTLDRDELATGAMTAADSLGAPGHGDESIVVVEADSDIRALDDETIVKPAASDDTGQFESLEDTFSSETAVNLDQTDPLAEADFHMAYGLYDQAADLINGALESDPSDKTLMAKLCEIYFVWGNRDAFIDAATRLDAASEGGESAEWDKIVIMGQQIAGDHELFAGAGVAGATRAVDLSFDAGMDEAAELDMDFGGDDLAASDVIDLGAAGDEADDGVDFMFDPVPEIAEEDTEESLTIDQGDPNATAEMPAPVEPTVETPTIEQQFQNLEGTSDLPSIDDELDQALADDETDSDSTAEIEVDDLGLDITGSNEALEDTGINETLDEDAATGANPEVDPDATGIRMGPDTGETGFGEALDLDDLEATGFHLAADETGQVPGLVDEDEQKEAGLDHDLLDATGHTQILSDDLAVGTTADKELGDDEATLLAPMDDDEEEFDFAKTEALPADVFTGGVGLDETNEMPAVAETDMDLDLDDLTAALQVSEVGDTVEQTRDDATVEQPRPDSMSDETAEVPTMSLSPDDMSDDLMEARTMTEVGTKLDLARAYVDMGDPAGARSILEEVLDEGDEGQRQQAQQLLDSLPTG